MNHSHLSLSFCRQPAVGRGRAASVRAPADLTASISTAIAARFTSCAGAESSTRCARARQTGCGWTPPRHAAGGQACVDGQVIKNKNINNNNTAFGFAINPVA